MNTAATSCMRLPSVQCFCIPHCGVSGRNSAAAITRCSSRSCARVLIWRGGRGGLFVAEFVGFERFIVNLVKRWDAVIPFEQRGGAANEVDGVGVHLPYGARNRMIAGVEKVLFEIRVVRH